MMAISFSKSSLFILPPDVGAVYRNARLKSTLYANRAYDIFIRQRDINEKDSYLNAIIGKTPGNAASEKRKNLCDDYWDIRTFGAVLSTGEKESGENAGEEGEEPAKGKKERKEKIRGAGTVR